MEDYILSTAVIAIAGASGGLLVYLYYTFIKWIEERKKKKKFKKAEILEEEASTFLQKNGYEVIERHPEIGYTLSVNGEEYSIKVTPDYLVRKEGEILIAEVKTGESAPDISNRHTRRQILEYYIASEYDGVILVDMENREINRIDFHIYEERDKNYSIAGVVIAIAIVTAMMALFIFTVTK